MQLLWQWIERYGIPQSLYTDKKNVYVIDEKTREKAAESGEEVFTQLGVPVGNWASRSLPRIRPKPKAEWNAITAFIWRSFRFGKGPPRAR